MNYKIYKPKYIKISLHIIITNSLCAVIAYNLSTIPLIVSMVLLNIFLFSVALWRTAIVELYEFEFKIKKGLRFVLNKSLSISYDDIFTINLFDASIPRWGPVKHLEIIYKTKGDQRCVEVSLPYLSQWEDFVMEMNRHFKGKKTQNNKKVNDLVTYAK